MSNHQKTATAHTYMAVAKVKRDRRKKRKSNAPLFIDVYDTVCQIKLIQSAITYSVELTSQSANYRLQAIVTS
jgi:hypothetical protein